MDDKQEIHEMLGELQQQCYVAKSIHSDMAKVSYLKQVCLGSFMLGFCVTASVSPLVRLMGAGSMSLLIFTQSNPHRSAAIQYDHLEKKTMLMKEFEPSNYSDRRFALEILFKEKRYLDICSPRAPPFIADYTKGRINVIID